MRWMQVLWVVLLCVGLCKPAQSADELEPKGVAYQRSGPSELWPLAFDFSPELTQLWTAKEQQRAARHTTPHVWLWLPEVEHIRAILMIPNNTDLVKIGEFQAIRDVAAKHHIAIMYFHTLAGSVIERSDPEIAQQHFTYLYPSKSGRNYQ